MNNEIKQKLDNFFERKVSIILSIIVCIVFIIYKIPLVKNLPCDRNIVSTFATNFVHTDYYHLIANLYGLFAFSKIEDDIGSKNFAILVSLILVITSVIESYVKQIFNLNCSIGISGLIFGLFGYDLTSRQDFDFFILSSITIIFLRISAESKHVSFYGHVIGLLVGIVLGFLLKFKRNSTKKPDLLLKSL
jgi:membrane associated rhomboid family serine protease